MVFLRETAFSPPRPRIPKGKGKEVHSDSNAKEDRGGSPLPGIAAPVAGKKRKALEPPPESLLHRLAGPSTNKAGLKRDPQEVRNIIYESSRGGHYFNNEERKDEILTAQIGVAMKKLEDSIKARGGDLSSDERKADRIISEQESRRNLSQYICVVDCDAFYASVEELDNPELKGKPFGVGEGVLTTASYEARKFGCRSAMPGYIAKKLCPDLIFVKLDFTKYTAASKKVMEVLARYDPNLAPASLDEAYMNLTAFIKRTGMMADAAVQQMREEVKTETGLTVSAGVGANTMLAKIAADFNKPDGQYIVAPIPEACRSFMQDLSVRKIPGIGRVTERWLEALGVVHCRDIYTLRGKLVIAKGEAGATGLLRAYLGIGNNVVERGKREDRRGVGHETTFSTLYKPADLEAKLREIADSLAEDLARSQYSGRTLTLKLKLETYEVLSRAYSFDTGQTISSADDLFKYGKQLLDNEVAVRAQHFDEGKPIKGKGRDMRLRLMGLKVSNLTDESSEAQQKRHGKGTLHQWTQKANKSSGSLNKVKGVEDLSPIDLTLMDDSGDESDGFEEIFLESAPCPHCRKTVPYANDAFNDHVTQCGTSGRSTNTPGLVEDPAVIDLSMSSQPEVLTVQTFNSKSNDVPGKPLKRKKESGKAAGDAFTKMMRNSSKAKA